MTHGLFFGAGIINLMLATYGASRGDLGSVLFSLSCAGLCFFGAWKCAEATQPTCPACGCRLDLGTGGKWACRECDSP